MRVLIKSLDRREPHSQELVREFKQSFHSGSRSKVRTTEGKHGGGKSIMEDDLPLQDGLHIEPQNTRAATVDVASLQYVDASAFITGAHIKYNGSELTGVTSWHTDPTGSPASWILTSQSPQSDQAWRLNKRKQRTCEHPRVLYNAA